jgi:hypothetical protein
VAATNLDQTEKLWILPNLPHGEEASAARFEQKLTALEDGLEAGIAYRTTVAQLPVEQRTTANLDEIKRQILEQRAARHEAAAQAAAQAAEAQQQPAAPAAVVVAPQAPPPAAPPPAAAVVVPGAPVAAVTPAPTLAQQAGNLLLPERSLPSEALSIGAGIGGGVLGGLTGPFAPVVAPVLAGAGSAVGEAGQVGLEHVMGWPPAERGTLPERMARAGARGLVGEGAGQVVRGGAALVRRAVGPALSAAEQLAPVLAQDLPAGVQAVESATPGMARNIGRLLQKPEVLAKAELSPEGQQTLLRAWWQENAPRGPAKLIADWDRLGPEAQLAMAGEQHAAMDTVIDSLRKSAAPISATTWQQAARAGTLGPSMAYMGFPKTGAVIGAATEIGSRGAPMLLLRPGPATFLSRLPQVARVASPYADYGLTAVGQAGATLLPQEVR